MNREFANCYLDSEGRDIENGKLTWLIVVAMQRARRDQVKVLENCYGQGDHESAAKVKNIYNDLNLRKNCLVDIEQKQQEILQSIQQISKLDKVGLSQEFFFKLFDNMDANSIG